jgi:hypothetical protein
MDNVLQHFSVQVREPHGRTHMAGERQKLGVYDAYQQPPAMPLLWPSHTNSEPSGPVVAARRDERGMSNLKPRYQRSI